MQPREKTKKNKQKNTFMDMEEIRVFFPWAFHEESIREKFPENKVYGEVLVWRQVIGSWN